MSKFQVDQKVHLLASGNERRRLDDPWREVTIARTGRKYVYARDRGREVRFDAETGAEVTDYSGSRRMIFSDEEKAAYLREQAVYMGLRRHGASDLARTTRDYSTETLEAVVALLDADVAARAAGTENGS